MAKPTLTMRRLGRLLEKLRKDAGMTTEQVASTKAINRKSLRNLEEGTISVRWPTCKVLAEIYGAPSDVVQRVVDMAMGAETRGYREKSNAIGSPDFQMFFELEPEASEIKVFDPEVITGLLQTKRYMTAVLKANPDVGPSQIPDAIAMRRQRQKNVFERDGDSPQITFVTTEGVMQRLVGGEDVRDEQLQHLSTMVSDYGVDVRVILNSVGAYFPMNGPFTLLESRNDLDPPTVYLESYRACEYIEEPEVVRSYRRVFAMLVASSIELKRYLNDVTLA